MDKKMKLLTVLAVLLILLTMPASAYTVTEAGTNHIQVKYSWYEAAWLSGALGSTIAANHVMTLANNEHMDVNRNTASIAAEIVAHAGAYLAGEALWGYGSSNPVDIIVSESNWDWMMID